MLVWILLGSILSKAFSIDDINFNGDVKRLDEISGRPAILPSINNTDRIINGVEARGHSWPWQVSIQRIESNGISKTICGGTVIAPNKILTAAHCFVYSQDKSRYTMVVGKHDLSRVEALESHATAKNFSVIKVDWKKNKFPDDIIVIHLTDYLEFNEHVIPIRLAKSPRPSPEARCFVTGWGKNVSSDSDFSSDVLLQAEVKIQTDPVCQKQKFPIPYDAKKMICAHDPKGEKDTCQGDSGGPLVCLQNGVWSQYGIVSFGKGCAEKNRSGVYTRVSNYYNWLQQQIKK